MWYSTSSLISTFTVYLNLSFRIRTFEEFTVLFNLIARLQHVAEPCSLLVLLVFNCTLLQGSETQDELVNPADLCER